MFRSTGRDIQGNPLPRRTSPRELAAQSNPDDRSQRFQSLSNNRRIGDLGDRGSRARCHFGSADGGDATHRFGSW